MVKGMLSENYKNFSNNVENIQFWVKNSKILLKKYHYVKNGNFLKLG